MSKVGIYSAFCGWVQLYEILQDGFHTPLSAAQIADLFHAGRVDRHTGCKAAGKAGWRTIDEVFPLLKYDSSRQFVYEPPESRGEFRSPRFGSVTIGLIGSAATAVILYVCFQDRSPTGPPIARRDVPIVVSSSSVLTTPPSRNNSASPTATALGENPAAPADVVPVEQTSTQSFIRSAEAQRIGEQARRDQLQAQQDRAAKEQRLLEQQKAGGRDQAAPLDHWQIVNVGGEAVSVMIHDNDTTSFDVSINYGIHREVKKQKGITGSGTDETLNLQQRPRGSVLRLGNQRAP